MLDHLTIIEPTVTEKSMKEQKNGKYTFYVGNNTNKIEIAKAIKRLYGVEVKNINIVKLPTKSKISRKGKNIKRKERKKAIISIDKKQNIDFTKIKEIK